MNSSASKTHWSFWAIGAFALVWNALGGMNYIMQMNMDVVASLPDTHQAIINGRPSWASAGFAIGVFGGALAALLLLFKKPAAFYVFIVSLLGVLVTMIHTIQVARSVIPFSGMEVFVMIVLPVIVAAILVWYSLHLTRAQAL